MIMRVIAADKILADFGHRFWSALRAAPEPKSNILAQILSLLKGANQCHSKDSAMPTHFFIIPLHEDQGIKPDSIF